MKISTLLSILTLLLLLCGGAPASELHSNSDRDAVLGAIVQDVLTNPDLKDSRDFYGNPGDKKIALVSSSGYGVPWPKKFNLKIKGYEIVIVHEDNKDRDRSGPHILGIRIDRFGLATKTENQIEAPIHITLLNAGGNGKQAVIGGCTVYYFPKKQNDKWIVEYAGSFDI